MTKDKTRTVLIITCICLSLITLFLFTFYKSLSTREPFIRPSGSGSGFGGWVPGDDRETNGTGTTVYMKNQKEESQLNDQCRCRWMINVYRDASYSQKVNEIGWLKGHSNGLETWYTKHVYDIQTDRSLLNQFDLKARKDQSLSNTYRGETIIEVKHIQGCDSCFGSGEIAFKGIHSDLHYNGGSKRNRTGPPPPPAIDVTSETVLNQRDRSWHFLTPARDYARLRVQAKTTDSIESREEYTIDEYGLNDNLWPRIAASCHCDHKNCTNPVEAFMRSNELRMLHTIGMFIIIKKDTPGTWDRDHFKTHLLNLSSEGAKPRIREVLEETDWENPFH